MVFGLLTAIIPIVVVVFVIAYAVNNKERGEEETMIRHLYTYLVLFATLMMVIGGGISIFMASADLISPPSYYETYSDFKMMKSGKFGENLENKTEEELRAEYEQLVEDQKTRHRENAKNQIIKSLGFIVIPLPVFLYFNRLRKQYTS